MLARFSEFVNQHRDVITFIAIIFLASLLAFALGYLIGSYSAKEPLEIVE